MKILNAGPGLSAKMNEPELLDFLSNHKINLHLGTLDDEGYPNIHPIWYYFDRILQRIYFNTDKTSKKLNNILKNPVAYFCIDSCTPPYKGVRGKGNVRITWHNERNEHIAEKILLKYLEDLKHPMAISILDSISREESVIVEIDPVYYSTWDDSKNKW